jgi:3-oxoacyl-[acyl-carrier protein] reductase
MSNDKRVLVTGASKGIGKNIALELAKEGYELLIHFNSDEKGALATLAAVKNLGSKGSIIGFNISDRADVKSKLNADIDANGAYYGVVCNAGITRDGIFPTMSDDDWDSVLHTNLDGFYNVVKPCVMPMISKRVPARIIVMSSVSGVIGNRGQVNYSASKAGLIGAAKALAMELAKRNITVNCIAPGIIDTGMVDEKIFMHAKEMIPMQRMGTAKEVSSLVKYLMSEDAAYITRQVISVNGGMA